MLSNLDNLTARIIKNAEQRAAEIAAEAKAESDAAIREIAAEAEREVERIMNDASAEAERVREQAVVSKRLELRDLNLKARQDTVGRVFARALERLNAMPKEDFLDFLVKSLSSLDTEGQQLLLPSKYDIAVTEINERLKALGKPGGLTLMDAPGRDIPGGFVLMKDGIELNSTFESLIEYNRFSLEAEIMKELF